MRMQGMENLFSYEGWGIIYSEGDSVGVEIIRVAAYLLSLDGKEKGM